MSKARNAHVKFIPLITIDDTFAEREDASPDAAADKEEDYEYDKRQRDQRRSEPTGVAPTVDAVVDFSVDGADAFLVVVGRLVGELLGVYCHPKEGQQNCATEKLETIRSRELSLNFKKLLP